MNSQDHPPDHAGVVAEISREIARVHLESYGEPVRGIDVAVHAKFVAVLMAIELNQAEKTLIEGGYADTVKRSREAYQSVIEPTFIAVVERATGRRVNGFASRALLDENPWSAEVFRFA